MTETKRIKSGADGRWRTRQPAVLEQSAVIPWRMRDGMLQVALVTASNGPHWTIPKGHVEPDMAAHESAAKEAFEEAGLLGQASPELIGRYTYDKASGPRRVAVYAMQVTRQLRAWPEMHRRRRRWLTVEEAASRVASAELRCCLQSFGQSLRRGRNVAAA